MSDITIPSYRVPRERAAWASWRTLGIAGGVLGAAAVGGAVVWGTHRGGAGLGGGPRPVPVLEADARPVKVRPENPGGMVVPNTDQLVLEPPAVRRAAERQQGANTQLAPPAEAPQLDLLRRQAAPPPDPTQASTPVAPQAEPVAPSEPPRAATTALGGPNAQVASLPPPRAAAPGPTPAPASAPGAAAPSLAPPVAATASPAASTAPGRAAVQLGALASEEAARAEWARLQRRVPDLAGRQPQIQRFDRGTDQPPLWRLRAGGVADAPAARSLCEAVRAAGGACVPLGGGGA